MDKATRNKLFSAERQQLKAKGMAAPVNGGFDVPSAIAALGQDIRNIEQLVRDLKSAAAPAQAPAPAPAPVVVDDDLLQQMAEINLLKTEIRALSLAIEQTKSEIAALRPPNSDEDRLIAVTGELDAIVTSTERATHDILEAAETIDGLAERLENQSEDAGVLQVAGDIHDIVMKMFEACNFQDITGQRITKVVKTLDFIEQRVNRMIDIWGRDAFEEVARPAEVTEDDDKRLLNGPALENQGVSQADIDKLFD